MKINFYYKMLQREREIQYFRINKPYGYYIKGNFAFPFNRNYSNLGKENSYDFKYNFVDDDIDFDNEDGYVQTVCMYNDGTNPYSGWFKNVPNLDLLEIYYNNIEEIEKYYAVIIDGQ